MDLRNAVSSAFAVELPATAAFDYPTASALAAFVIAEAQLPAQQAMARDARGSVWQPSNREEGGAGSGADQRREESKADILAGVRAAVEAALGTNPTDDEPLMEVPSITFQIDYRVTSVAF